MRSVARVGDLHECADEGPNENADLKIKSGSPNITINGQPAARMGDPVNCRMAKGESPVITEGASNVLFNGLPAARMGDKISNGGSINSGSSTFFIGEGKTLISFGDGVKITFRGKCNVLLNCRDENGNVPPPEPPDPPAKSHLKQDAIAAGLIVGGLLLDEVGVGEAMQAEGVEMLVAEEATTEVVAEVDATEEVATEEELAGPKTKRRMTSGGKEIEKCCRSSRGDAKIDELLAKGEDITNPRSVRNVNLDMTREEFEKMLSEEGYNLEPEKNNPKQIRVYTKDDIKISVRNDAKSTGGSAADYRADGDLVAKIRFN